MQREVEILELEDISKSCTKNVNIKYKPDMATIPENDIDLCCESSPSPATQKQEVICIRSAYKRYDITTDSVLKGLYMTVPKGIIYGLLGASGCGKTTLLNCIVGLKKLDYGSITVLDGMPSSRNSGVPGPRIGYMPQETALYGDFTIRETLVFFGWISGMTSERIKERIKVLLKLLMLPKSNQRVKTLSGGQQRRVSLATALLHEPELLILDEPTVGLDSVLRANIWDHFLDLTNDKRTTVVITTHYIDEARNANVVALMRGGRFLVEESPETLLKRHGLETLEELFFKLSYLQEGQEIISDVNYHNGTTTTTADMDKIINKDKPLCEPFTELKIDSKNYNNFPYYANHMKALLWKNFLWAIQNFQITLLTPILPFVLISLLYMSVGNYPADLNISVVNYETRNVMNCEEQLACNNSQLSCHFFKYLAKHNVTLIPYDSEYSARESVLKAETYASIVIKNNYSIAMQSRVQDWQLSNKWEIQASEIEVFRDVDSKFVANYIKILVYHSFQSFLQDYMTSCNISSRWLTSAITVTPVYGSKYTNFREFVIPGIMLTFIYVMSAALALMIIMIESNEGLLERILVSGVNKIELLTAHIICQFVMMVVLTSVSLICTFAVFNTTLNGSLLLLVILSLMVGFGGMCFGLCASCVSERMAYHLIGSTPFQLIALSGVIWPIEGMHCVLKPFALSFPLTYTIEGMRSIMYRGWGLSSPAVYMGFISITLWTISFLIISILIVKFKKD